MTDKPADLLQDVAGVQIALATAVKFLLAAHRQTPEVAQALTDALEESRVLLMNTAVQERQLRAFAETAETLIAAAQSPPPKS